MPSLINIPHQVIMADTSFSDMKSPDCRGLAMNEVISNSDPTARVWGMAPNCAQIAP